MKVSVLMITYNHEKFISQALESVLMQEVNFTYEIIVGEDCSTDGTRDILLKYQQRYPERIRALLPQQNLGMMQNFMETYRACTGEYVAILEGDDYWTSSRKLQLQVDFLDSHSDFAMCFHNAEYHWQEERSFETLLCRRDQKKVSTIEDIILENFIPTLTVMFRNKLTKNLPEWFDDLAFGDWPLHVLNARYGKIWYEDTVMARYRVHSGGAASGSKFNPSAQMRFALATLNFYGKVNGELKFAYSKLISRGVARQNLVIAKLYKDMNDPLLAIKHYLFYLVNSNLKDIFRQACCWYTRCKK